MSNDRLWIQCVTCGEKILLAKWDGADFTLWDPEENPRSEHLAEVLTDHIHAHALYQGCGLKPGAECFRFLTEADPEG